MGWANLFWGRYDEAVSWARKAALEKPDWASTVRLETIACALSGGIVEAQEALARLREIDPDLRPWVWNWRRAEDLALFTRACAGRDYRSDRRVDRLIATLLSAPSGP